MSILPKKKESFYNDSFLWNVIALGLSWYIPHVPIWQESVLCQVNVISLDRAPSVNQDSRDNFVGCVTEADWSFFRVEDLWYKDDFGLMPLTRQSASLKVVLYCLCDFLAKHGPYLLIEFSCCLGALLWGSEHTALSTLSWRTGLQRVSIFASVSTWLE